MAVSRTGAANAESVAAVFALRSLDGLRLSEQDPANEGGPGLVDTDTARFYVFTGNVSVETDEFGIFANLDAVGDAKDICAMIA